MSASTRSPSADVLQAGFLSLLPRIRLHAQVWFRHLKCPHTKADAIGESVALAWAWYVRLAQKGKDPTEFVSVLAAFAVRAVKSGRGLCGQERALDVLSPLAQRRHNFTVSPLPPGSSRDGNVFDEALQDNRQTPVPDQVVFRCDFPAWRRTRAGRDRRLLDDLMLGERTGAVARKYGLSPGRVSQLRRELHADWLAFCGDLPARGTPATRDGSAAGTSAC
jgi:hypothetical protein